MRSKEMPLTEDVVDAMFFVAAFEHAFEERLLARCGKPFTNPCEMDDLDAFADAREDEFVLPVD